MHVRVSRSIRADHDEIERMVAAGFSGVSASGVAVHVKARGRRVVWFVACTRSRCRWPAVTVAGAGGHLLRRARDADRLGARGHAAPSRLATPPDRTMTGRAYDGVPPISSAPAGTRHLVTLIVPPDPAADPVGRYPHLHHYHRARSVAPVLLEDWRCELVHLVAHEAAHVAQFRAGAPRSEVGCERWAAARLDAWLSERPSDRQMPLDLSC
ncbi:MAG TPA: hypothetical protein VMU66_01040 [Gaiellales bacterium]|nr:hypothetical protein [Gaiellales bacterium]